MESDCLQAAGGWFKRQLASFRGTLSARNSQLDMLHREQSVFESTIPPAKQASGPTSTSSGSERCGLAKNGLLTLISQKLTVIFKSKALADR